MRALLILNQNAGTVLRETKVEDSLRTAMREHDVDGEIRALAGGELASAARDSHRFDIVIACGGDGTINTVAVALAGSGKPMGIIPLGTHNHFAREMNIPLVISDAMKLIATSTPRSVHLAEVNGKVFLNFSGVGIHPDLVKHREAQQRARGRSKWVAFAIAAWRMFTRFPLRHVRLLTANEKISRLTSSVFVVLSPLQAVQFGLAELSCTDRTKLNVYMAKQTNRRGVAMAFIRAALGLGARHSDFQVVSEEQFSLHLRGRTVRVSIDGEVIVLNSPLIYRVLRDAIQIIAPA